MLSRTYRAYAAVTALAGACALTGGSGCVQQRPSRNGVFNENQYVRKDFLIADGDGTGKPDSGWFVKTTITSATTPNVLGSVSGAGLFAGAEGGSEGPGANFIRFQITQDKLQMISLRELSNNPVNNAQGFSTPEIVNAWPITNVDLKYQVNLDGEKTNFYQENQELDWQVRQWVKINFAKNDLSDLYAFAAGQNPMIQNCTDLSNASVTLVTDSFSVDTVNNQWEFTLNITVPIAFSSDNYATCAAGFGSGWTEFQQLGRQNVSLQLRTVFVRPESTTVDGTYVPLPLAEKDPIQHKYGAFQKVIPYRDPNTQLLGAQSFVERFNPNKDIVYYLSPGMPAPYQTFFTKVLEPQTNAEILSKTGAKGRLKFLNYNDATTFGDAAGPIRANGDPRYSFINWHSDLDNGSGLLGIAQFMTDPRTGETISATVNLFEGPFQDSVLQRLDLFLQTVGSEYLTASGEFDDSKYPGSCTPGQVVPLVPGDVATQFNQQSTVYAKMQAYLQKPFANYGYLGPSDFLPSHDADFYNAYYAVIPYQIYSDPQANPYTTPEPSIFGSATTPSAVTNWQALQSQVAFEQLAGQIDSGEQPFDTEGPASIQSAVDFYQKWSQMAGQQAQWEHARHYSSQMQAADDINLYSYFDVYQKNGRHCTAAGTWESRTTYVNNLIQSLNEVTAVHEFGHTLGLRHNFMGSVDQRNYSQSDIASSSCTQDSECAAKMCPVPGSTTATAPCYGATATCNTTTSKCQTPTYYASSVMDYNQMISEAFFESNPNTPAWGPYDMAAIGWIYSNNLSTAAMGPVATPTGSTSTTASGQVSATAPWNDPIGFNGTTEHPFLFCTDEHVMYTPLCRRYDMGSTPSEIMANDLQRREWNYLWTNFRLYHKYFSEQSYANSVATDFNEMRRFTSLWFFDWSDGELANTLRLIGTPIPSGATVADYYTQLTNKFDTDISVANQLQATYHRAIIEQSSGERPYITVFDPYFGDVTQQGIQLDKVQATTSMSELWNAGSNYDPSQAAGTFISSVGEMVGDNAYTDVSLEVLADYLGAAYATYQYSQLGPIANFAASTHSTAYLGNLQLQTWIGGWQFTRDRDFLDFVHQIAVTYNFQNCDLAGTVCSPCTSIDNCTWDPRTAQASTTQQYQSDRYNQFQSPDGRTYIWGYVRSRNQWILADKDRNNATYALMLAWTQDVVNGEDDGYNGASSLEYRVRYITDAFTYYDGQSLAADSGG